MKSLLLALSFTLLATPALAQPRPFRMTLGGAIAPAADTLWLGLSLDTKRLPQNRTLSLYADSAFSLGGGCGGSINLSAPPSNTYAGFEGIGVSLRQSGRSGWVGAGLGGYTTHFSECGVRDRKHAGLGAKIFVGTGGGLYFTELTLTVPSVAKHSRVSVGVGFRL
ncbi:hypothetical protein [Armatimonas sp.]|uniref:hypothetical protein n=1 Tax=Armatimonas sp. TaxID=1872638 RepID=UPI00286BF774|nr:hypothetical protein [Armatimonas sp.]